MQILAVEADSTLVWQALIVAIVTVILAYLQYRTQASIRDAAAAASVAATAAAVAATSAAIKVDEKKKDEQNTILEVVSTRRAVDKQGDKLNDLAKVAEKTHDLINSASLVQLKLYAISMRRVADLTKDPADIAAAKAAEKLLNDRTDMQNDVLKKQVSDGK